MPGTQHFPDTPGWGLTHGRAGSADVSGVWRALQGQSVALGGTSFSSFLLTCRADSLAIARTAVLNESIFQKFIFTMLFLNETRWRVKKRPVIQFEFRLGVDLFKSQHKH